MDPVGLSIEAINIIVTIAHKIYDQVELAKANQQQCQTLKMRIMRVVNAIQGLEKRPLAKQSNYHVTLKQFKQLLEECLAFVQEFAQEKTWFKRVLKAGNESEKFNSLNQRLCVIAQDLQIGLAAQNLIDQQQDKKDQNQDQQAILANQVEILRLNQEHKFNLQKIIQDQAHGHEVLMQQMASMKFHLMEQLGKGNHQVEIDKNLITPFHELEIDALLAEGSFGKVYLGRRGYDVVAVKLLSETLTDEERAEFIREVKITARLLSPHIVQLLGVCDEPKRTCLLLEYMAQGSLEQLLAKRRLEPEEMKRIAIEIAKGLHFLHSKNILHRDLKTANILVNVEGHAKLADFGLAAIKQSSVKSIAKQSHAVAFTAPEMFQRLSQYTKFSEIYSYGMILYHMVTRTLPFEGYKDSDVMAYVQQGKRLALPSHTPEVYCKMIEACWSSNPQNRPSLSDIITQLESYTLRSQTPPAQIREQGLVCEQKKQYAEAKKHYERAAQQGFFAAKTSLASLYYLGNGVAQDKVKAAELLQEPAAKGHPHALYNLGYMYYKGEGGLMREVQKGAEMIQRSANKGYEPARKWIERHQDEILNLVQTSQGFQKQTMR